MSVAWWAMFWIYGVLVYVFDVSMVVVLGGAVGLAITGTVDIWRKR